MALSWYLIAIFIAWVTAQGAKYLVVVARSGDVRQIRHLYLSGNMPSAHSASVTALMVTVAAFEGVESAVFAVAALFAAIVMYDAMMVRRSSGEQGAALQLLMREQKSGVALPRVAKGHTPLEVAVGALLGAAIAAGVVTVANIVG